MRARLLGGLAASLAALVSCNVLGTRLLATAFNQGVLDSTSDPAYPRSQRASDTVMWRMRDELGDGYFGQGAKDARVVGWLAALRDHADPVMRKMLERTFAGDGGSAEIPWTPNDDASAPVVQKSPASQQQVQDALDATAMPIRPPEEMLCNGSTPNWAAIEHFSDYVRFSVALRHAVDVTSKLVDERFATVPEVVSGAQRAFGDTSVYLGNRKWKRDRQHKVAGLVVKGGAATGVFSAGVVWVTLSLIDQCIREGKCDDKTSFAMASGTSTGATVVTAADVYESAITSEAGRKDALRRYLDWYLCSSMNDLYCVRNHTAFNLARGEGAPAKDVQDALLDFNGLASKVEQNYGCTEMQNGMELILNTVDFRTGRLYSLSDQDPATLLAPWDVSKAVVSSAALPFIVRPTYHLPVDPFQGHGNFAYLDGGIRSELPLLALVRRGVERLVVVSSGASITGDNVEIGNALSMAIRYIDIETGGVTEAEIDHARARAESSRLAEHEYCMSLIRDDRSKSARAHKSPTWCTGECDDDRICSGDFAHACMRVPGRQLQNNEEIVKQTFQMANVWRNEDRVPGLPGYAFNPVEQRRLMLAGAEAARDQCTQIAAALGIPVGPGGIDEVTLHRWCTPRLPQVSEQCPSDVLKKLAQSADAPDCPNDDGPKPNPKLDSTRTCGGRP